VKRVLVVATAAVALFALGACSDTFSPPEGPDLFKEPYDFAVVVPPYKGDGGTDMATVEMRDLANNNPD